MASFNFNALLDHMAQGRINFATDSFKLMLLSAPLTETEKDGFDYRNDITTEITGLGYTAGGAAVTMTKGAIDTANNRLDITGAVVTFSNATITAQAAVIYKSRGGAASADELISHIDFAGTVTSTNGTYTVTPTGQIRLQN
jgi:hypothetical protein